jgi:hypothetical protein
MKTPRTRLRGPLDADRRPRSVSFARLAVVMALGLTGVLVMAASGPAANPTKGPPPNDTRAKAQALADLPAKVVGSTSSATH